MATPVVASDILQLGVRAQIQDEIRRRTVPSLHMCFPIGKNEQVRGPFDRLVAVPIYGCCPVDVLRLTNLIVGDGEAQVSEGMKIASAMGAEFGGLLASVASACPIAYHVETHFATEELGIAVVSTLKVWRMRAPLPSEV